jgi:hypothetical protein
MTKRQQSKRNNHPRIRSVTRTPGGGFAVEMDAEVETRSTRQEEQLTVRTTKADGSLLARPVREHKIVEIETIERKNGVVVREVKRRKSARRLGVAL